MLSAQTHHELEILVVVQKLADEDDSAGVTECADFYRPKFSSLRLIEYVSAVDTRSHSLNLGIGAATGRYLAFLDDDDKLYPAHFSSLIERLQKSSYAWAFADVVRAEYDHNKLVRRSFPYRRGSYSYIEHLKGNFIPIHAFVIDRERVPHLPRVDERLCRLEDYDFLLHLAHQHEPLYTKLATAEYCIRNDGSNSVQDGDSEESVAQLKRKVWNAADTLVNDKKIELVGWWIREFHTPLTGGSYHFRSMLDELYRSRTWRAGRPLRNLARKLRGMEPEQCVIPPTEQLAEADFRKVLQSTTWEIFAPIRLVSTIARRVLRGRR
ncbi:glycosyltransferase family 2 protein [Achromobacter denitrificans]|uniref:Glycosyltransferase n=1 Tax=Achromobacter denitrificans TaxID=32002 RepID=A0ABZ3FYF8_ACHDE